ncbi:hypothetical protein UFOVP501_27 [uncultured Caudovirales phage]|uniref:Uncharacterized protein n=1 Tax=uncultured Caudovirales phage TaxID=2100421 RepID=A0A6J5QRE0_9CAUD|nr:hypothetical protein UFOVP501_27 [uncultured Caudovirales phage]CAB4160969.1 hypothetical protein UFOVP762_24 [uncultured Caudovirales phage]CAB4187259.1 hypothetical protein UFOVP1161_27 [uncultured Caudovirales phage]
MTASLIPSPVMQFTDATGAPLVGGKVYTYAAGTTTPLASYTSYAATSSNTNPVILDSRGEAAIWFGNATYKVILKDSTDTLIWTSDNISAVQPMAYVAPGTANNLLQSNGSSWASVSPSTVTVGNATEAASAPLSGVTGLGTGVSTFLATPSSANLAAALTDETGSGSAVFATSPTLNSATLISPVLGIPTSGDLSNCTGDLSNCTNAVPAVYTGTSASNPTFPVGSCVAVDCSSTAVALNSVKALYLKSTDEFSLTISGTALTGTWNARGISGTDGGGGYWRLFQRTA